MAKNKKKKSAIGLSIVALIAGLIIGAGSNFGITTASYDEMQNQKVNEEITKVSDVKEGIIYDKVQVNFLELGNKYAGDCTYIKVGDIDILIDAGSRADSVTTIKKYIDKYCSDNTLEYVIATHGHQDHIAALVGNSLKNGATPRDGLLYQYSIGNLIYFSQTNNSSSTLVKNFYSSIDYLKGKGTNCIPADEAFTNHPVYTLKEGVTLIILWNKYYFEKSSDENDHSVISMIQCDDKNFLFTGDLEEGGEKAFASYYDKSTSAKTLPSHFDLYKGGHHGSKTSSNDVLLDLIDPQSCCICCCAGATEYTSNKDNTFPTQKFIDRISKHTDAVYVTSMWDEEKSTFTSMNGNITASSDGNEFSIAASNNLIKLKDTAWFTHKVYVNEKNQIVKAGTPGATEVEFRKMPEAWQKK